MSDFDVPEECPHCDDAPPSRQIDIHIARAHADLPPCTARIETEHRETYRCAFRAGHDKGQYGKWHASARGNGDVTGRYVWNDSAKGATPHRAPEPSYSLDKLKAMGVLSHTVVAAGEDPMVGSQDTGLRCPRCDCADNAPQCEHCKVCRWVKPQIGAPCTRPECGSEIHTDQWGTAVRCPHEPPQLLLSAEQTASWMATQPPPPTLVINGRDGAPLVTIHPDGVLEYGPGYEPDEAARCFWDALRRLAPARCPACGHVGLEVP